MRLDCSSSTQNQDTLCALQNNAGKGACIQMAYANIQQLNVLKWSIASLESLNTKTQTPAMEQSLLIYNKYRKWLWCLSLFVFARHCVTFRGPWYETIASSLSCLVANCRLSHLNDHTIHPHRPYQERMATKKKRHCMAAVPKGRMWVNNRPGELVHHHPRLEGMLKKRKKKEKEIHIFESDVKPPTARGLNHPSHQGTRSPFPWCYSWYHIAHLHS